MRNSKNDSKPDNKKSKELVELDINKNLVDTNQSKVKEYSDKENSKQRFHLNSIITKNISLFTENPNYKLLAWLIVQLIIFSLFIFSVNIFKNYLIPYFNY